MEVNNKNPPFERKLKIGDHRPDFEQNIINSDFFVVHVTDNYFKDGKCFVHTQIANWHKKPFIILVKKGVIVPPEFLADIKGGYRMGEFETAEEHADLLLKLLDHKNGDEYNFDTPYIEA